MRGKGLRPGSVDALPGVRLHLERNDAAVSFPQALLSRPLALSNSTLGLDDTEVADWKASGPANDFSGSLLQVMATLSSPRYPRIGVAAHAMQATSAAAHIAARLRGRRTIAANGSRSRRRE